MNSEKILEEIQKSNVLLEAINTNIITTNKILKDKLVRKE